jgi:hypothetical protein
VAVGRAGHPWVAAKVRPVITAYTVRRGVPHVEVNESVLEEDRRMGRLTHAVTCLVTDPFHDGLGVLVDAAVAGGFVVHALRAMHRPWMGGTVWL